MSGESGEGGPSIPPHEPKRSTSENGAYHVVSETESGEISEAEIGDVLAAALNHPAKAATLGAMEEWTMSADGSRMRKVYDRKNLNQRLNQLQGNYLDQGWTFADDSNVPIGYCLQSLEPINLVAKVFLDPAEGTMLGVQITPKGEKYLGLVGPILDLQLRKGKSMQRLFAQAPTSSHRSTLDIDEQEGTDVVAETDRQFKVRAPINRLRILRELSEKLQADEDTLRAADLVDAIGITDDLIGDHLNPLSEYGFINYERAPSHKPFSKYRLSLNPPNSNPAYLQSRGPSLTNEVYGIYQAHPGEELLLQSVLDRLIELNPGKYGSRKPRELMSAVAAITADMARQGYVEPTGFTEAERSKITLNDDQRAFIQELLSIIDGFKQGDPNTIIAGQDLARTILADDAKIARLMGLASEESSMRHASPPSETMTYIGQVITDHPNATYLQIAALLAKPPYNKKLSESRVRKLTAKLAAEDPTIEVTGEKGQEKHFSRRTQETQSLEGE